MRSYSVLVLSLWAACLVSAVAAEEEDASLRLVARALESCQTWERLPLCLQVKAVGVLERALHAGPLNVGGLVSLVPEERRSGKGLAPALSEQEIEASLPAGDEEREAKLDEMIGERVARFISSRSVQLNTEEFEGRGKDKKGKGGMMMMAAGLFAAYVHKALGVIALIAGKALLIGKIALLISAIIGLKKLTSSDHKESHSVVYADHHDHHRRSLPIAHELAYSAHARSFQ